MSNNANINSGETWTACGLQNNVTTYNNINLNGGLLTVCGKFNLSGNFNSGTIIIGCGSEVTFSSGLTMNNNVHIENYGKVTINGTMNFQNSNNVFYNESATSVLIVNGNMRFAQNNGQHGYLKNNGYIRVNGTFDVRNGGLVCLGPDSKLETNAFNYGNNCSSISNRIQSSNTAVLKYNAGVNIYATVTNSELQVNNSGSAASFSCSGSWGTANVQVNSPAVDAPTGAQPCSVTPNCYTILPIELYAFTVDVQSDENVINWQTASENDNDHFNVRASDDGINWETIETVPGAGTSKEMNFYSVTDRNIRKHVRYYRIEQVNTDGSATSSEIISVSRDFDEPVLYPNPASNELRISVPDHAYTTVSITDQRGIVVYSAMLVDGQDHAVDATGLSNGFYFVRISGENTQGWIGKFEIRH